MENIYARIHVSRRRVVSFTQKATYSCSDDRFACVFRVVLLTEGVLEPRSIERHYRIQILHRD
jgi:hypothetical protein